MFGTPKIAVSTLVQCTCLCLVTSCVQAQWNGDMLMASLEQPAELFLPPLISDSAPAVSDEISTTAPIHPVSKRTYSSDAQATTQVAYREPPTHLHSVSNHGAAESCTACGTGTAHVIACEEDPSYWEQKSRNYRRKAYFNYHKHTKTLYPISRPYCHPSYGYYETCWKRLHPEPCYQDAAIESSPKTIHENTHIPPAPMSEEARVPYDR